MVGRFDDYGSRTRQSLVGSPLLQIFKQSGDKSPHSRYFFIPALLRCATVVGYETDAITLDGEAHTVFRHTGRARAGVVELPWEQVEDNWLPYVRVADTKALQRFMQDKLKPLDGVTGTETLVVLDTVKETTELAFPGNDGG